MVSNITDFYKSAFFDAQLCALGDWEIDKKNMIDEWIETNDPNLKSRKAGLIISAFSNDLLPDSTPEGRSRISRLEKLVTDLESLVFHAKSISNKFYRDHLNHLIKVTLLSKCLARLEPFNLDPVSLNHLLLASLFHDVSYPLTNSLKIFESTLDAIKDCYSIAEYYHIIFEQNKKFNIADYLNTVDIDDKVLMEKINQMNHGVYSAIEFMNYLKQEKEVINKYKDVIETITLHDSDFDSPVDIMNNPILGLLIVADELQDWGRPSILSNQIMIKIKNFEAKDNSLSGTFIQYKDPEFSIFKQIIGKWKNLSRIQLSSDLFNINLKFEYRKMECVEINLLDEVLIELYSHLTDKSKIEQERALIVPSIYERSLYGYSTRAEVTAGVCDSLRKSKTISSNYNYIINNETSELLITLTNLNESNYMRITNESHDSLFLFINTDDSEIQCHLYNLENEELSIEVSRLLSKIRLINWLIYEFNDIFEKVPDKMPKYEGLLDNNKISYASTKLTGHKFIQKYYNSNIFDIQQCIKRGNIFFLEEI